MKVNQAREDELNANICWFLKSVCEIRSRFVHSVSDIKKGHFYDAWCDLERIEIGLISLLRNPFLNTDEFEIPNLLNLTRAWQKTYPYKLFISPELLYKTVQCGICSANITPWEQCEHEVGVVYCGICCHHVVKDVELISVSIVEDPVQKYSVLNISKDQNGQDIDIFDYDIVGFVAERIDSPFDRFQVNWTKALHPHELYSDKSIDGPCPCESGRSYLDCCRKLQGVLRPHIEVIFEKQTIDNPSNVELVGYGEKSGPAKLINAATSGDEIN